MLRYLHQVQFDSNIYSFSPGVNWTLTSRCSGSVIGLFTRSPSTITQLVGTGVNYATLTSATETGKCSISNRFSVLFNGSVTDTTNSNPLDAVNNSNSKMIAAGIEYAQGDDNVTLLATKTDTDYSNRGVALNALGLSNTIVYNNFNASYTRTIDPNLSVTAQLGLVGVHLCDHAEGVADGVRQQDCHAPDDGYRQRSDVLSVAGDPDLSGDAQSRFYRHSDGRLYEFGLHAGAGRDELRTLLRQYGLLFGDCRCDVYNDPLHQRRALRLVYRAGLGACDHSARLDHGKPEL